MQQLRRHLSVLAFALAWLFASQAVAVGLTQGRLGPFQTFSGTDVLCLSSASGQPGESGAPDTHSDHHEHCLAMGACASLAPAAAPPAGMILSAPARAFGQATTADITAPEIPAPPFREGKPRGPPSSA